MKRCPQCNRTYADETLTYCLADGSLLSAPYDPEATQVMSYPTNLPPTIEALPLKQSKGHSRNINLSYIIIVLLAVLLTGSAVALFYEKGKGTGNSNIKSDTPTNPIKSEQNANTPTNSNNQEATASPSVIKNQSRFSVSSCNSIKDSQTGLEWYVGEDRNVIPTCISD